MGGIRAPAAAVAVLASSAAFASPASARCARNGERLLAHGPGVEVVGRPSDIYEDAFACYRGRRRFHLLTDNLDWGVRIRAVAGRFVAGQISSPDVGENDNLEPVVYDLARRRSYRLSLADIGFLGNAGISGDLASPFPNFGAMVLRRTGALAWSAPMIVDGGGNDIGTLEYAVYRCTAKCVRHAGGEPPPCTEVCTVSLGEIEQLDLGRSVKPRTLHAKRGRIVWKHGRTFRNAS